MAHFDTFLLPQFSHRKRQYLKVLTFSKIILVQKYMNAKEWQNSRRYDGLMTKMFTKMYMQAYMQHSFYFFSHLHVYYTFALVITFLCLSVHSLINRRGI